MSRETNGSDGSVAIRVEGLGKRYRIGAHARQNRTLRETLTDAMAAPWRNLRRLRRLTEFAEDRESEDVIWALRDIDLEVERGEVLGIVGRNGAGKSTLLKVLSRITEPTEGRAIVDGNVGSLLEVGTGFHPELTGRDNVYLNGAILGMDKSYIDSHFDEIVEFSGVERFIDTPVKRYSSGMRVRLAFAVAAHLQPEVLIIDEVLSVGDAEFQKKCLGKMDTVARSGRTVLFVSHNMTAVQNLCSRCVWIEDGSIRQSGSPAEVVHAYLSGFRGRGPDGDGQMSLADWPDRSGGDAVRVLQARLFDETGRLTSTLNRLRACTFEFDVRSESAHRLHLSATIVSETGDRVLHFTHDDQPGLDPGFLPGRHTIRIHVPSLPLNAGNYKWRIAILTDHLQRVLEQVDNVLPFSVEDVPESTRPYRTPAAWGYCWTPSEWTVDETTGR